MANLIYSAIASLDGYTVDETGGFDWAAPDEQVHAFVNDLERPIGTYLYGRRMYEVMQVWDTMHLQPDPLEQPSEPNASRDFAKIWRAADKIVYSTTLAEPATGRTRIERTFDPAAVRATVAAADRDVSIGGAHLAGQALAAGLVDECQLLAVPVIVGGGTRWLPDGVRLALDLMDERRFDNGTVYLRYRIAS